MFHVIDRPPFDDFTFELFIELYKNRKNHGLQHAEFIYTWTGHMSLENGLVRTRNIFDPGSIKTVPENITDFYFWKFGYKQIIGDGRYLNHVDDLYQHFLETMVDHPDFSTDLYDQFRSSYFLIYNSFQDKRQLEYKIQSIVSKTDTVVLFVKDHFRVSTENSWVIDKPELSEYFSNMCSFYPNKRFILVTSLENLDQEINVPNCTIIPMGGDITNQIKRFSEYAVVDKKQKTSKHAISLNRGVRNHRTYLVSLLYGLGLDQYTNISYLGAMSTNSTELRHLLNYDFSSDPNHNLVQQGFDQFLKHPKDFDSEEIYSKTTANDNIYNFNMSLREKYKRSFLEFVTETNYNERSFNVTEKLSHSVFGYNIPIIVSSPRYVEFLRSAGFDVFDDIVDHSYDLDTDKVSRLYNLVVDNLELITTSKLIEMFEQNKPRLERNCDVLLNHLPKFYYNRFWEKINKL